MNKEKIQEMFFKMAFDEKEERLTEKKFGIIDHNQKSQGTKIVILQRGWVAVGELFYNTDNGFLEGVLKKAKVIRNWGTTKGIGEIALGGPNAGKTVLDECGTLRFNAGCEVAMIDCDGTKWSL